ncbi:MAG: DMT family transporter [Xylophilus ampelinus]
MAAPPPAPAPSASTAAGTSRFAAAPAAQGPVPAIAMVLTAMACFSVLDATTKLLSGAGVPVLMAMWARYGVQAVVTAAVLLPWRGLAGLRTANPRFQLLRGVLMLMTSLLAFFSLRTMPVGEFTALVTLTPLAITVLAARTLGERVSVLRWALVAGGFCGALVVIRPGGQAFGWTLLLPLGVVVTNAWFQVLTSRMARTEEPLTMHCYTGWVGFLITSALLPSSWQAGLGWAWAGMVLTGVMGTVGHMLLILGYRRAPASTLAPFLYGQIVFSVLAGWLVFSHVPDRLSLAGIGLVMVCGAAGAWLAVRERQRRLAAEAAPAAPARTS